MSKTAHEMFKELGFIKNTSECYNDNHILYEKPVQLGSDIFSVEFKENYFVYTNLTMQAIKIYPDLLQAINKQMKELRWL